MADSFTSTLRALVAATLLVATATVMLVAVNTACAAGAQNTSVTLATIARAAGALAIGACGVFGEAYDFRTVDEARTSALAKCQNDTCRVVTVAKHGCAAFAVAAPMAGARDLSSAARTKPCAPATRTAARNS